MSIEEKQGLLAVLLAKLGVFFASCDGEYDLREKNFIQNFVSALLDNQMINDETRKIIEEVDGQHYSIEDVIQDSRQFSQILDDNEKESCLFAIKDYIKNLIEVDGVIHPAETENFKLWKHAILNK